MEHLSHAYDQAAAGCGAVVDYLARDPSFAFFYNHPAHSLAYAFLSRHAFSLLVAPLVALVFLVYYLSFHVRRPHLVFPMTKLNHALIHSLPRLHRAYWPTFYLTHEILQAAVGSFVRWDPRIKRDPHFQREIRTMADGERIALDWLHGPEMTDETPIVFTCHGLAGHTDELNMQYLALGVRAAGMRFAIFNRRGCALDMKLTRDFLYLWGCTSDMREILAHVKARYPRAPLFGVGYSAGSNLLTKYLGETGRESLIDCALSVANSFDVAQTSAYLARKPFHSYVMVNILKNMLARNEDTFRALEHRLEQEAELEHEQQVEQERDQQQQPQKKKKKKKKLCLNRVKKVKSVLEWDEHFSLLTHRQYTNSTLEEFYREQSTTPEMIANISVPLLNLHALDDPIIPDAIVPYRALHANANILVATTARGGHLGYTQGVFPFASMTWMEHLTVEYFQLCARPDIWKMIREGREKTQADALAAEEAAAAAAAKVEAGGEESKQPAISSGPGGDAPSLPVARVSNRNPRTPSLVGANVNTAVSVHLPPTLMSASQQDAVDSQASTISRHTSTESHAASLSLHRPSASSNSPPRRAASAAASAAAPNGVVSHLTHSFSAPRAALPPPLHSSIFSHAAAASSFLNAAGPLDTPGGQYTPLPTPGPQTSPLPSPTAEDLLPDTPEPGHRWQHATGAASAVAPSYLGDQKQLEEQEDEEKMDTSTEDEPEEEEEEKKSGGATSMEFELTPFLSARGPIASTTSTDSHPPPPSPSAASSSSPTRQPSSLPTPSKRRKIDADTAADTEHDPADPDLVDPPLTPAPTPGSATGKATPSKRPRK